ncbi:hypothetical protein IT568_00345 [bacterium]|nr:hypothetical protein [bacterium]
MAQNISRIIERRLLVFIDDLYSSCKMKPPPNTEKSIFSPEFKTEIASLVEIAQKTIQFVTDPEEKAEISFAIAEVLNYFDNSDCAENYLLAYSNFFESERKVEAITNLVDFWLRLGNIEEAENALDKIYKKISNPEDSDFGQDDIDLVQIKLAKIYYNKEQLELAKQTLKTLGSDLTPKAEMLKEVLTAKILIEEKDFENAKGILEKKEFLELITLLDSQNEQLFYYLHISKLLAEIRESKLATELLKKAIDILRKDEDFIGMSETYFFLGEINVKAAPTFSNECFALALIYSDLGNDTIRGIESYLNFGLFLQRNSDIDTAIDYFDLSFKKSVKNKFSKGLIDSFEGMKSCTKEVILGMRELKSKDVLQENNEDLRTKVANALIQTKGNKIKAAEFIGVDNSTFHRYLNNLGFNKDKITRKLFKESSLHEIHEFLGENEILFTFSVKQVDYENGIEEVVNSFEKFMLEKAIEEKGGNFKDLENTLKASGQKIRYLLKKHEIN